MTSGFDWAGNIAKYGGNNYTLGDLANNTFSGVNYDYSLPTSTDTSSLWSSSLFGGGDGISSGGGMNWMSMLRTAGKLGNSLGAFFGARDASKQSDYIPTTQWLGNGLARTGYINNTANKQNKLDQTAGAANSIGQFFELFGKNKLSGTLDDSSDNQYSDEFLSWLKDKQNQYGGNYGV